MKKSTMVLTFAVGFLALMIAGCGGGDGPMTPMMQMPKAGEPMGPPSMGSPEPGTAPLAGGDWFPCVQGDCNHPDDESGYRFSADGKVLGLQDPNQTPASVLGQTYCERRDGTYSFTNGMVVITWQQEYAGGMVRPLSSQKTYGNVQVNGDRFTATTGSDNPVQVIYLKITPTRATFSGPCS